MACAKMAVDRSSARDVYTIMVFVRVKKGSNAEAHDLWITIKFALQRRREPQLCARGPLAANTGLFPALTAPEHPT